MFGIELQPNGEVPLFRQIYQTLRDNMIEGLIRPGEALPSTRQLAKHLGVSRNTVLVAYEMLSSEGFTETVKGSSTRVSSGIVLEKINKAASIADNQYIKQLKYKADFRTGRPDLNSFPKKLWLRLQQQASQSMHDDLWDYSGPEGLLELREQISFWLFRSRGIAVNPQNIFITAGATQALHLLSGLFDNEKKDMITEDPCHTGMLRVLQRSGYTVHPMPVDENGLRTELLKPVEACAIYVTPSHQFPLGGILPAARRTSLIRFARENNSYIIEDDYDSEFRYCGSPITPLYSMDPERVIYIGTFSKIMFPALRIGYIILPAHLHSKWRKIRTYSDVQNTPFEEAALAEFIRSGKLERYINKMRKVYSSRRQILLDSLNKSFGKTFRPWGDEAGLHIALQYHDVDFDSEFVRLEKEHSIYAVPVEHHCIMKGSHKDKLLLGYGHMDEGK
ncbi:MAG TPA: PLP-dependent aminotransferase family protein, partial [Clostridia bacterium]|nr:PLP-dependent aminotransferase family protein [Clostridia bacterium]